MSSRNQMWDVIEYFCDAHYMFFFFKLMRLSSSNWKCSISFFSFVTTIPSELMELNARFSSMFLFAARAFSFWNQKLLTLFEMNNFYSSLRVDIFQWNLCKQFVAANRSDFLPSFRDFPLVIRTSLFVCRAHTLQSISKDDTRNSKYILLMMMFLRNFPIEQSK